MSKVLEATCEAGVVTCQGVPVPDVIILSEGVGDSTGILILQAGKAYYVVKGSPDLDETLENLINALGQIVTAYNQAVTGLNKAVTALTQAGTGMGLIDAKPTGGSGSASTPVAAGNITAIGTNAADITAAAGQITTAANAISAIKTDLETLKGDLV